MKSRVPLPLTLSILALSMFHLANSCPMASAAEAGEKAAFRLPAILSDNMVLQAGKPAKLWGWAPAGSKVTAEVAGKSGTATAGTNGKWGLALPALEAGGGPQVLTVRAGSETLSVKNVLIGEVWLCSGQSNMQFTLKESENAQQEVKSADYPAIRYFSTGFTAPLTPQDDVVGKWVECSPKTAGDFSAVSFFFGRELHRELKVPVGLVHSSQGATAAEYWTPMETLRADPEFADIIHKYEHLPKDPKGWDMHLPGGLYNGKIAPLTPLALRGIIWYQGETNGGRAFQYRKLFPALITRWRAAFGEELPFYYVQLAAHFPAVAAPKDEPWAELREAQTMALTLPSTGMAVAVDLGEAKDIHPKKKREVGERLSRLALARTYGRTDLVYSGPLYRGMKVEGGKIRVEFDHVGGGLEAKGSAKLERFAIAGADRKFVWAEAEIQENDAVLVSSPDVPEPVAVRYAWANNPEGANLYNKEGLPASPFRTDDWPGVTDKAHNLSAQEAARKPDLPEPLPPVPPSVGMTGNTLEIAVGQEVKRTWDMVKVNGYEYVPQQAVKGGKTTIWLPYGTKRGLYHDLQGMTPTDSEPRSPAELSNDPAAEGPAHMTFKFHFDKTIGGFGLDVGNGQLKLDGAVLAFEYSTDGRAWTTFREITKSGEMNGISKSDAHAITDLDTCDLYLRCILRDQGNPQTLSKTASIRIRMAGDPGWGDAKSTFIPCQWRLVVSPK